MTSRRGRVTVKCRVSAFGMVMRDKAAMRKSSGVEGPPFLASASLSSLQVSVRRHLRPPAGTCAGLPPRLPGVLAPRHQAGTRGAPGRPQAVPGSTSRSQAAWAC